LRDLAVKLAIEESAEERNTLAAVNPNSKFPPGAANMLSNQFREGFIIGALLVFGIFLTAKLIARARVKSETRG
jgi:hypothetical protein